MCFLLKIAATVYNFLLTGDECRPMFMHHQKLARLKFLLPFFDSASKCIQMSTNKPSIESVVLEIAPQIVRKYLEIVTFYTKTVTNENSNDIDLKNY